MEYRALGRTHPFGPSPHTGNAALSLAIPFASAAIVALIGALMTLDTGTWSFTSEVGRAGGWGWVRWSSVAVIMFWIVALLLSG